MAIDQSMVRDWRDHFILSAEITAPDVRRALYRGVDRGDFVRLARGAFVSRARWDQLDAVGRHRERCRAVALTNPGIAFSHQSAAVVWGLPLIGDPGGIVHAVAGRSEGGSSTRAIVRHRLTLGDEFVERDGLLTTSLPTTAIDLARGASVESAVAVLDFVLGPGSPAAVPLAVLLEMAERLGSTPGSARARFAVSFADGRSGSVGESISRLAIHRLGFPAPDLQVEFRDFAGLIGRVDFWWEELSLIGEFDGIGKYLRDELTGGRSPGEVVVAEKRREDRLRACGARVVRWGWAIARSAVQLRRTLTDAGLRAL